MKFQDVQQRGQLAEAVRAHRAAVARDVTEEFLTRHPEWLARYGERARQFGIEDAGFHQDFLAAAIDSGELETFNQYCQWAARMLASRKIAPEFLAENLDQISQALHRRLSLTEAETVDRFIRSGLEACFREETRDHARAPGNLGDLAVLYTEVVIAGRRQAALNLVLEAVRQGHTVPDIYADVLQAAMYRIGTLWEENRISVAQEHMATAITQFVIAHLYPLIPLPERTKGKIVITGVEGEQHQIGGNMVADILEANGWDVRFLGTNIPVTSVLQALEEHEPAIVGISATMLFSIPNVVRLVDAIRTSGQSGDMAVILGGAAFRAAPDLYKELGANGCSLDLRSAVQLVAALDLQSKRD